MLAGATPPALSGGAIGAAAGGLLGLGIEEQARVYNDRLSRGIIL